MENMSEMNSAVSELTLRSKRFKRPKRTEESLYLKTLRKSVIMSQKDSQTSATTANIYDSRTKILIICGSAEQLLEEDVNHELAAEDRSLLQRIVQMFDLHLRDISIVESTPRSWTPLSSVHDIRQLLEAMIVYYRQRRIDDGDSGGQVIIAIDRFLRSLEDPNSGSAEPTASTSGTSALEGTAAQSGDMGSNSSLEANPSHTSSDRSSDGSNASK